MFPAFEILGKTIHTYGLCMLLGIFLAAGLSIRRGKRFGICMEDVVIVGAAAVGLALVGGGLLYILVSYSWSQIWAWVKALDFRFLFAGGIVFYGGLIGAIPGAALGVRLAKCSWKDMERTVVPFIPLGHALGRIGCLMGGCCYGMAYAGPLAVRYPHLPGSYFPVQPLEALLNVGVCGILLWRSRKDRPAIALLTDYLCLYALERFGLEFLRGDAARGIWLGISLSQWISLALLAVSLGVKAYLHKCKK